ncbi:MAG: hypothetical protein CML29_05375 [Rhizobiales bacterium]|nr:hypothetical protein [Hyphomicrobiales bacterium]MBA67698.1 hypothetical protein [Hyphomicrobiales bacterium]|tara:strand:- start:261 stop:932 length:672 start_codon:yes stop_codon:yes gene_type:complete
MSQDDSRFIREVNEELRSDAMKALWRKYRFLIIGLAVLIVVGTAAMRGWDYWQNVTAARSGDRFLAALDLAQNGKTDEALSAFSELEKSGDGSYPVLARLRSATVTADRGDKQAAADEFLAAAKDGSIPQALRDIARIRAGYLLVDVADYNAVSAAVEVLAVPENGARHSAREILGLAAWKAGDMPRARDWFEEIEADTETPSGIRQRAGIMLDLIAGRGETS